LHTRTKYILLTAGFAVVWLGSIAAGFAIFARYDNTPGAVGQVPQRWQDIAIPHANDRPTLVMIAHPRCPCTRASIDELAQIMARVHGKLNACVLFYKPKNSDAAWDDTALWREAAKIPGVTVMADLDGAIALRLGAETSGHTFLFAADGRLLFNGGITESRGHVGDNAGEGAIVSLVRNSVAARDHTFVFGCSLTGRATTKSTRCLR
jgi:hypothetical protein